MCRMLSWRNKTAQLERANRGQTLVPINIQRFIKFFALIRFHEFIYTHSTHRYLL